MNESGMADLPEHLRSFIQPLESAYVDGYGVASITGDVADNCAQFVAIAADEIECLREAQGFNLGEIARARALISWIDGACVDERPHMDIRDAINRYQEGK